MKEEHQVKEKLSTLYKRLENLSKADYGTGKWRRLRGYIDGLEWILEGDGE